eukprot:GHUV01039603.1.p1 GENE.GHUV01039603.1~~GHUV01039603.1.p1  ORF type:complete len:119 (-),score=27.75 GHUV01039603.1:72-428(-)
MQRKMSQMLMRIWPTPFPRTTRHLSTGNSHVASTETSAGAPAASAALVAHEGAAEVATSLYDQLRPYLDQADDAGMPVCLAGHSLGEMDPWLLGVSVVGLRSIRLACCLSDSRVHCAR